MFARATALRQRSVRRVEGNLPIELDLWLKAKRGYVVAPLRPLDLKPLRLIQQAPVQSLEDPEDLTDLIGKVGLSDDRPDYYPDELHQHLGRGLRIWQYPEQLAPYLCAVGNQGVETYLEIGAQHGGTFCLTVEYLQRRGDLSRADAVDFQRAPAIAAFRADGARVCTHRMNSASRQLRSLAQRLRPDLVLIDGDHSAVGCMMDFEAVEPYARMIAFHDISDPTWEVDQVWEELQHSRAEGWRFEEFTHQYLQVEERVGHPVLGIGLMTRR